MSFSNTSPLPGTPIEGIEDVASMTARALENTRAALNFNISNSGMAMSGSNVLFYSPDPYPATPRRHYPQKPARWGP